MIRVLHVLGTLNPGGVETWLMNVLRHSGGTGVQMDFCTFGPEKGVFAAEAESLGSIVHSCPIQEGAYSLGRRFRSLLREGRYNAVHSHVHHFSGVVLHWAHKENVLMRISHSHSTQDGKRATIARRTYRSLMSSLVGRHATHCLAASRDAARALFGQDWERDPRVRVLYYGIDVRPFRERVDARGIRADLKLPLGVSVIGHLGRFVEPKNHAFLVKIAREVIARRRDCHFLLVGDGPLRPPIEELVQNAGLCENVTFAGLRKDVPRLLLGAMDLFLFPSLWEGLPIALLEAQAAGLPCVISDRVTNEAIILEDRVMRCALENDAAQWGAHCLNLSSKTHPERSAGIEQFAKSAFTIQNSVANLMDVYQSACGHK
jgi:glycosyltransferase involved in cell wall biosynthesis